MAVTMTLWHRQSLAGAEQVPQTFSSWDNCMAKSYCKFVKSRFYVNKPYPTDTQQMASDYRHHCRISICTLHPLLSRSLSLLRSGLLLLMPLLLQLLLPFWPAESCPEAVKIRRSSVAVQFRALSRLPAYPGSANVQRASSVRALRC